MNEYTIKQAADFLTVPQNRLKDCLAEFAAFLETVREFQELCKIAGELVGETEPIVDPIAFHWIDDGKRNVTINIMAGDSKPPTAPERTGEVRGSTAPGR
jgi:hypothetical protein